ncbi:MAG: hypothetical protein ACI8WB_002888 [Phenylobacterium sp.]|jgi:hypothetical protein
MKLLMLRKLPLWVLLLLAIQTAAHHLLQKFGLNQGLLPLLVNEVTLVGVWAIIHFFRNRDGGGLEVGFCLAVL